MNSTIAAGLQVSTFESAAGAERLAGTADDSRTIGNAIARRAASAKSFPAMVGADSQLITYSDLVSLISRFGRELANAGLRAGHRVGLLVPPGMPGGELAVALASNVTLVPINPALKRQEVIESAGVNRLHAIVIPRWLETEARSAILQQEITVFEAVRAPHGTLSLELLTRPARAAVPVRPVVESDVALLLRSSGTTGAPKLIPVTHGNLAAMAEKMGSALWYGITAEDRAACTAPLYYAAGLKTSLFVPLMLGAGVAFPSPQQTFDVAEWVDALAPTYLSVAPGALQRMIERTKVASREFDGSSLRFVMCGASYLPEETRAAAESMLRVPVLEFYGLSEAGIMAANPVPPGKAKPGTVGLPAPGELLVVDENRQPVANGAAGEIMICGPTLMPGYVATDGANPDELKDGWLLTGDIGQLDEEGYLCLAGRAKEVINRGGEKVFPYEVEKAILQHPAVLEAAAFGVPHPRLGESVAAAIVLKPGMTVPESELREFLAVRLAGFKLPRRLCYVPGLPRGGSGKVLRRSLSETYATAPGIFVPPKTDSFLHLELLELWKRLLGISDIGLDDDFFDKGGDSLLATELLIEIEALTGKPYPQSELATLTIRRVAEVVASELPAERELMTQAKRGSGIPVFFCHGDYVDRGLYAHKLAALLPDDHPIFLLHSYADRIAGSSVEDIARVYLERVLDAARGSPVFIAGYCNGGIVAWHLAYLLRRAGVEVVELLLIETMSLNARPRLRVLPRVFRAAGSLVPGRAGRFLREHGMRHAWYWARRLADFSFRGLREEIGALQQRPRGQRDAIAMADRTYLALMSRYVPPPLDVCVTCFIADQGRHIDTDPTFWRRLAPSVSSVTGPGTHQGLLIAGRQALATKIADALERATRRYVRGTARPAPSVQEAAPR
jgi:acyl-CoA synthetase (AMP-forming)/AMP-acid ligase II/thioesterase domain-containing protein/acyl carrier protein